MESRHNRGGSIYSKLLGVTKSNNKGEQNNMDSITEREYGKSIIASLVALQCGIGIAESIDVVCECERAIADYEDGSNEYNSIAEILMDYLGLGEEYKWIFVDTWEATK